MIQWVCLKSYPHRWHEKTYDKQFNSRTPWYENNTILFSSSSHGKRRRDVCDLIVSGLQNTKKVMRGIPYEIQKTNCAHRTGTIRYDARVVLISSRSDLSYECRNRTRTY